MGEDSFFRDEIGQVFLYSVMGLGWDRIIFVGMGWHRSEYPLPCHSLLLSHT